MFSRRYVVHWLVGGGAVLLLVAGGLWWCKLSVTPENVFWGMIEQSLRTGGVSMHATQEQGGATFEQDIQYSLGADNQVLSHTTIKQGTDDVKTETLGTRNADYTRYVRIITAQTNSEGKPLDVSKVTGVWAKTDNTSAGSALLGQGVLGLNSPLGAIPVPIGHLTPEKRAKLMTQIRQENVYETSFSKAKKEVKNGRLQYTYEVTMQAIPYVHLMKSFSQSLGLHELDQLDQNSYQGSPPLVVKLTVDARSRQLIAVHIPESDYRQTLDGYDLPVGVEIPKNSISAEEMQKRISELR